MIGDKSHHGNRLQLPDRRAVEGMMREFAQPREPTPVDEAQELMYQAWESDDPDERIALARRALELSTDCADAWVLLAEEGSRSIAEAEDCYRKGVEAGERALGEATFAEHKGHFWGLLETRPYMRARFGLAQCLWERGERDAAIQGYQDMIELNPRDDQAVRHVLLGWLLDERRHDEAYELIRHYQDDSTAWWGYFSTLLAYREEGDSADSRALRARALAGNRYVPAYLAGRRKLPKYPPAYVGIGDKDEAIAYVFDSRPAWRDTPGAIPWLLKGKR